MTSNFHHIFQHFHQCCLSPCVVYAANIVANLQERVDQIFEIALMKMSPSHTHVYL
jgi:hypothetical protein